VQVVQVVRRFGRLGRVLGNRRGCGIGFGLWAGLGVGPGPWID